MRPNMADVQQNFGHQRPSFGPITWSLSPLVSLLASESLSHLHICEFDTEETDKDANLLTYCYPCPFSCVSTQSSLSQLECKGYCQPVKWNEDERGWKKHLIISYSWASQGPIVLALPWHGNHVTLAGVTCHKPPSLSRPRVQFI